MDRENRLPEHATEGDPIPEVFLEQDPKAEREWGQAKNDPMGGESPRQGNGMDVDQAVLQLQLRTRRMTAGVVRRLPATIADRLRGPVTAPPQSRRHRAHDALLHVLRRGGIPAGVTTFTLGDNRELMFVNAESLVLHQLYWFGEQGWEPQLLPWWRRFCRHSSAILELGAKGSPLDYLITDNDLNLGPLALERQRCYAEGPNVGYFTVQGAKAGPQARYIAVEPYPTSARVCRANLELNRAESVELVTAAAVAHAELAAVELHVPSDQLATPTVAFIGADTELPERDEPPRHADHLCLGRGRAVFPVGD